MSPNRPSAISRLPSRARNVRGSRRLLIAAGITASLALPGCLGTESGMMRGLRGRGATAMAAHPPTVPPGEPPGAFPAPPPASQRSSNDWPEDDDPGANIALPGTAPVDELREALTAATAELANVAGQLTQLEARHAETLKSLDDLRALQRASDGRTAALETAATLQAAAIDDLKRGAAAQQEEQWRTLDAISDAIDRVLESEAAPRSQAGAATSQQAAGRTPLFERSQRR
ncbi:MAG: hypothetical protein KF774_20140 [Planctomyces sp.]|nr:hypothetical protein [Planctomyces sp.]